MIGRGLPLVVALGAALIAVPACAPAPKVHQILMRDMAFGPVPEGLKAGDTIEWINADILQHTATARDGSFNVDLAPNAHERTVLKTPGVIAFYCAYHPNMTGQLEVAK